mmetsp:Transcript_51268/g.130313  ORF Transcript_51268/g.130313 Transcript_51268/m.130313 type:complete len:644 (+) Transcript_51268:160-2091(+)
MKCQKRTDTSMGCPAMHRWEMKETHTKNRDRLSAVKSTLDTGAPAAQPHLTLYGRDYAAKKKATTEAAFADLKMIQAIARTMTRKHEVAERKGPVSLNADSRKAEIYRVMSENHRLLEHIDNVGAFCNTQEMINEHKSKRRYVINVSHTSRLSGEYDQELTHFAHEDDNKFQMQKRSTELRKQASERLKSTTGSISLPSLTSAASSEPSVPPHAKQGATKKSSPAKNWNGTPGDADLADTKRGNKQAKSTKSMLEPAGASPARTSEPPAQKQLVRFNSPTGLVSPSGSAAGEETEGRRKVLNHQSTPHPKRLVRPPSVADSDYSEAGEAAKAQACEVGEGVLLNAGATEDHIVIEDDFISEAPTPQGRPPRGEAEGQEPEPAAKAVEEPPPIESEEALPGTKAAPQEAQEQPADHPPPAAEAAANTATEPPAQAPIMVPSEPRADHAAAAPDDDGAADDESYDETFDTEDAPPPEEKHTPPASEVEAPAAEEAPAVPADAPAPEAEEAQPKAAAPQEVIEDEQQPSPNEVPADVSYGDDDEFEDAKPPAMESTEAEPKVSPHETLGVSTPMGGLQPVSIARPVKQEAGAEDQGQDEYEDDYEDDFMNESATLAKNKANDFEATFEESNAFEEGESEEQAEDGA